MLIDEKNIIGGFRYAQFILYRKTTGLQGVEAKNIQEKEEFFEISIEQPRKECICPCCGESTNKIRLFVNRWGRKNLTKDKELLNCIGKASRSVAKWRFSYAPARP